MNLSNQISELTHALDRASTIFQGFQPQNQVEIETLLIENIAFRWQRGQGIFSQGRLTPISSPQLITFEELSGIDRQIEKLYQNTNQFLKGYPANNVLMTGARGTGKSSLVRACLSSFHSEGLKLIEVDKKYLDDLPDIVEIVKEKSEKFLIFCDDLSFEEGDDGYKGLKTVLDGSVAGPSSNVLIYATSNRRHLVTERMNDNHDLRKDDKGEIHPGDSIEEKISLSDRFGLQLHFYSSTQNEYLDIVAKLLNKYELELNEKTKLLALQWATQRGSRSGRIAVHFVKDYVGKKLMENSRK